jgi:GntR family transcriptional regulator
MSAGDIPTRTPDGQGSDQADNRGGQNDYPDPEHPFSMAPSCLFDQRLSVGNWTAGDRSGLHQRGLTISRHGDTITITMLDVHVDPNNPTPLHEQVAGHLRRAIAEGEAGPGERMPPARDLAAVLGVNSNTVLRALRQLRDEGLLEFRRGRGVTVCGEAPERSAVIARARDLVQFSLRHGYRRDELIQIIEAIR